MAIAASFLGFSACLVLGAGLACQDDIDFVGKVLPIFEARCFSCHSATYRDEGGRLREPQAGLRLDGRGWIMRGSDYAEILDPGNLDDSLLYELISLPADDELRMPAKGEPLSDAQIEVIRRWIESGADFGEWVGAEGGAPRSDEIVVPMRILRIQKLGEGLRPAVRATIDRAAGQKAQILSVFPGSPLLSVRYAAHQSSVGDKDVVALSALRLLIAELDLSRTAISDASIKRISRMPNLVRLDLHRTKISAASLASLSACKELRYLNLYGTSIGDAGLRRLGKIPSLQALYVWDSKVTQKGVAALAAVLPDCKIQSVLALPK